MHQKYWILMGDIIKSRKARGSKLASSFAGLIAGINQKYAKHILSPLTITLGDEFQGIVKNKAKGIEIIIAIDEQLLAEPDYFQIRYVLFNGKIDTPINPEIAYGMLGDGLTKTREQLTAIKKEWTNYYIGDEKESHQQENDLFVLYQGIINDWKPKDRPQVLDFLQLNDYKLVAQKNGKEQSLMWRRERSLKIREYKVVKKLLLSN